MLALAPILCFRFSTNSVCLSRAFRGPAVLVAMLGSVVRELHVLCFRFSTNRVCLA